MGIVTEFTKRKSHDVIKSEKDVRQIQCMVALKKLERATANEVAMQLYKDNVIPYFNRNFAHPRLNELVAKGDIEVVDKRKDSITGVTCAVYQVITN